MRTRSFGAKFRDISIAAFVLFMMAMPAIADSATVHADCSVGNKLGGKFYDPLNKFIGIIEGPVGLGMLVVGVILFGLSLRSDRAGVFLNWVLRLFGVVLIGLPIAIGLWAAFSPCV
jgi:type IV secretory pathway VirB2 component (pilin)